MRESEAPEWLVELIQNQSRLMSSTPKSVADAVWWELQQRIKLEIEESLDLRTADAANAFKVCGEASYRLVERETV